MNKFLALLIICISSFSFAQKTILWKVTKLGSAQTSYLLGTYHMMGNRFVDSLKAVSRALESSDVAIFENDSSGKTMADFLNKRKEDFTYRKKLDKKAIQFIDSLSADWAVPVSKLSASEFLLKIQQVYFEKECGTIKPGDTEKSFDNYLIKKAKNKSIQVIGLESDSQMTAFINKQNDDGWKQQRQEIYAWLDNIRLHRAQDKHCAMTREYLKFNLNYNLAKACEKNVLVTDRNADWLPKIEQLMHAKNTFVAVGFLHLTEDCGLISQLRKRGFSLEPVLNLNQ